MRNNSFSVPFKNAVNRIGKIEQENVIVNKVCKLITTCQSIADSAGAGCMEVVVSPPHSKKKSRSTIASDESGHLKY